MQTKKILKGGVIAFTALLITAIGLLAAHIYMVTRPGQADGKTVAMARIDVHETLRANDITGIGDWFYAQQGVDHVVINRQSNMVLFTFYPVKVSANKLAEDFASKFNYPQAVRYLPTAAEMQSGCPVAQTSASYKVYQFFKNIL